MEWRALCLSRRHRNGPFWGEFPARFGKCSGPRDRPPAATLGSSKGKKGSERRQRAAIQNSRKTTARSLKISPRTVLAASRVCVLLVQTDPIDNPRFLLV
jgi:hypothetical protein